MKLSLLPLALISPVSFARSASEDGAASLRSHNGRNTKGSPPQGFYCKAPHTYECEFSYKVLFTGPFTSWEDKQNFCASLGGDSWGLCPLEALCPTNPDGSKDSATYPAPRLYEANNMTYEPPLDPLFDVDQWIAYSAPVATDCE
eukprot:15343406-Ditylum_brightwellii.AAC.1